MKHITLKKTLQFLVPLMTLLAGCNFPITKGVHATIIPLELGSSSTLSPQPSATAMFTWTSTPTLTTTPTMTVTSTPTLTTTPTVTVTSTPTSVSTSTPVPSPTEKPKDENNQEQQSFIVPPTTIITFWTTIPEVTTDPFQPTAPPVD